MDLPCKILLKATAIFANKVISMKKPAPLFKGVTLSKIRCTCQELSTKLEARTKRCKRCLAIRIPEVYNSLPNKLKILNSKRSKLKMKKYEISNTPID